MSKRKGKPGLRPTKKSHDLPRAAERSLKKKSLADYVEKCDTESQIQKFLPDATEMLICPTCGWENDPQNLKLGKSSEGLIKCGECGEAMRYEAVRKTYYFTYPV